MGREEERSALASGLQASGVIRVEADVASAETVTIGGDVYEVEIVNTDTGDDTGGVASDFANTTNPLTVPLALANYAAMAPVGGSDSVAVGDLIRIETEMMLITGISGDNVTFKRGVSGTTIASHADAEDIYEGDGVSAGRIPVGLVATLTPTVFTDALIADINDRGLEPVRAIDISVNEILLVSLIDGTGTYTLAEAMAGVNNEVEAAVDGGQVPVNRQSCVVSRVPTAIEVAHGNMHFAFDFDPVGVLVDVRVTADGLPTVWDGAQTINAASGSDPAYVTLDNAGAVDWAATSTVYVYAFG